ncbi:MAG: AraC family transcriptional regulator [Candidatus Avispirillum sp.]
MDTLNIYINDNLELSDKDFYYSHRIINEPFDMYKTHAHNHYELYFLVSGRRNYFIGNRIVHVKGGDFVFVPIHTIHKTTSISAEGHERFLINFTENYFDGSIKHEIIKLFDDYCLSVSPDNIGNIKEIFKKISNEYKINDKHSPMLLKSHLTELFVNLLRAKKHSLPLNANESNAEAQIKKVLALLENDISADITVDYAADIAALSKSHFEKTFRSLTGYTFIEYLNTMRMLRAQKLLTKTSKSITEIAFECGFNSSNYFATVFRKYVGITPLKYRIQENKG